MKYLLSLALMSLSTHIARNDDNDIVEFGADGWIVAVPTAGFRYARNEFAALCSALPLR